MPEFIPGLELSRLFYWEIVRLRLDQVILDYRLPSHFTVLAGR